MDLKNINLNYYSFGLLGGFINKSIKRMSPEKLIKIATDNKMGGVEFPVDYLFDLNINVLDRFLNKYINKINIFISVENFITKNLKIIIPILKNYGIDKARIKMSNHFGGNRFKLKKFAIEYDEFINNLKSMNTFLIENDFQLLIENHQDLNSNDLLHIINSVSKKSIGVNWDIGNSLLTGETPLDFYQNLKDYIYNIHIKDYQMVKNNNTIEFNRCIIGEGNIGINNVLKILISDDYHYSMSIELGAYKKRVSHIFSEKYWGSYPCYDVNHKLRYFNFVNSQIKNTINRDVNKRTTKESELFQIEESINNIKKLN
jgi:sugar phosphate isomerase/epimerase